MSNQIARYRYRSSWILAVTMAAVLVLVPQVCADLDINAVAGQVKIDGSYAASGTNIRVRDTSNGATVTTQVDGPNIPTFLRGEGRYDTGDVPAFNTGDWVIVSVDESGIKGEESKQLSAGTTTVNLEATTERRPRISSIPRQRGEEDRPWQLDLDPYISDPDTPKNQLEVTVHNSYVDVDGHTLTFLYPEGITHDTVVVYVTDSSFTTSGQIAVTVEPVNDPPSIADLPTIILHEGSESHLDLCEYAEDPDHDTASLEWHVSESELVHVALDGSDLALTANISSYGTDRLTITVSDPEGLSTSASLEIEVEANLTALVDYYESQISELQKIIEEISSENDELKMNLSDQTLRVSTLESSNLALEDQLREKTAEVQDLRVELEDAEETRVDQGEEIAALKISNFNLTSRVERLMSSLDEMKSSYDDVVANLSMVDYQYSSRVAQLEQAVWDIGAELNSSISGLALKDDVIANLEEENRELEGLVIERNQSIERLEITSSLLEDRVKGLNRSLESERAALKESESNLNSSLEQITLLRAQLEDADDEIERLSERNLSPRANGTESDFSNLRSTFARAADATRRGSDMITDGFNRAIIILVLLAFTIVGTISVVSRTDWFKSARTKGFRMQMDGIKKGLRGLRRVPLGPSSSRKSVSGVSSKAEESATVAGKVPEDFDLEGLSRADREYVEGLIKLGYTKEARDEIRRKTHR